MPVCVLHSTVCVRVCVRVCTCVCLCSAVGLLQCHSDVCCMLNGKYGGHEDPAFGILNSDFNKQIIIK